MPTAAKLFAAFSFALVGFFAAEVVKPSFPEGFGFGYFSLVCMFLGVVIGWRVMGPVAGVPPVRAAASGVKTSFVLSVWALVFFSVREMVLQSISRRYDGVVEAIVATFEIMLDFIFLLVQSVPAMAMLIVGGMLGGMFSSWAAARWR
jgi:hypothetical protein